MNQIEDKYFTAIADQIIKFLRDANISAADLAAAANVDRKQVYRLINKEHIPKLSTLIKISLAAGIEPSKLFAIEFDFKKYMDENNIFRVASTK